MTSLAVSCNNQAPENKLPAQQTSDANAQDSIITTTVSVQKDTLQRIAKAYRTPVWVDSLDGMVRKGFKNYTDRVHHEKEQVAFIKASEALGGYYVAQYRAGKQPNLNKAMHYYQPVTMFREETDSEPGDNELAIQARNKLCKKVAALYDKGLLPASGLKSVYVGYYMHPEHITLPSTFHSMSNNGGPTIRFILGSAKLTKSAAGILDRAADSIRSYPARNIVVSSGGGNTELLQQICWDQTN